MQVLNKEKSLVMIDFTSYISIVNYFNNNKGEYKYITNKNGNKQWKDNNGNVIAKRIINNNEEDRYLVEKNIVSLLNNKK